jgi:hypothetical protein
LSDSMTFVSVLDRGREAPERVGLCSDRLHGAEAPSGQSGDA